MKKVIYILLLTIMLLSFSACGGEGEALSGISSKSLEQDISTGTTQTEKNESQEGTLEPSQSDGRVDVDLTRLSSTMIYSEVYNMILTPENYIGKTVKMQGEFAYHKDSETGEEYFACIIKDATACCSQGLEFVLMGNYTYPKDYPKVGSEITVVGTFDTYTDQKDGYKYRHLIDAQLIN